jgi:xanthine dehydrogenase small subunit
MTDYTPAEAAPVADATMRDHVTLWVNGVRREVRGGDAFLTLSAYLRGPLGLVGTKVVCAEGDCGACTVLVARPAADGRTAGYLPIDSCIRFVFQLDGCHVVTVEGLAQEGALAPAQEAMVECHGSQCGFCTPGFVMAIAGSCHAAAGGDVNWREELSGNLCRCTGYVSIFEAAARALEASDCLADRVPADWVADAARLRGDSLDVSGTLDGVSLRATCPVTLDEALAARSSSPDVRPIAGATDLGVLWNKGRLAARHFLDLSRLVGLDDVAVVEEAGGRSLVAGALVTWTDFLVACREHCPEFVPIGTAFGGPQIRHVGTVGGNIVNGSPIADSLPLFFATETVLELASSRGTREVPIERFYTGYKELDLAPDELLVRVRMPLVATTERLGLVKVSRRRDLDISTFTAAVRLRLEGDRIAAARVAYGGVGPTVVRMRAAEQALTGRPFNEETFHRAGDAAVSEIAPLTDVRGSADYRRQLARNVLLKFFHEQTAAHA